MSDDKPTDSDDPTKIGIHYQRSRHYRTINADGAQFGITPRGALQFTLFTDQASLPEYVLHEITPEGKLGKPIDQIKKEGIVREVAVNIIMDINTATAFIGVFQETLERAKQIQAGQTPEDAGENAPAKESTEAK
jgi:hypothetical protein